MKLPEPVAYLHVPLETWGERIRPVPSLLKYNEPDVYREVINLYGENQLREALASHEAVMRTALEALKQMMSIVAIHSRATKNNFAWAEMDEARAAIKTLEEQLK